MSEKSIFFFLAMNAAVVGLTTEWIDGANASVEGTKARVAMTTIKTATIELPFIIIVVVWLVGWFVDRWVDSMYVAVDRDLVQRKRMTSCELHC